MALCMVMCGAHAFAGLTWPLPEGMDDEGLELLLFPAPTARNVSTILRQSHFVFRLERLAGGLAD